MKGARAGPLCAEGFDANGNWLLIDSRKVEGARSKKGTCWAAAGCAVRSQGLTSVGTARPQTGRHARKRQAAPGGESTQSAHISGEKKMKVEYGSPFKPGLLFLQKQTNKNRKANQTKTRAPVLEVREGFLVKVMLKPRAEGRGGQKKNACHTLCLEVGGWMSRKGEPAEAGGERKLCAGGMGSPSPWQEHGPGRVWVDGKGARVDHKGPSSHSRSCESYLEDRGKPLSGFKKRLWVF